MPYLHLDLPATYPVQVKRELATRLCKVYAEVMETQLWRPNVESPLDHDRHHVTQRYRISEVPMLRVALPLPDGFATLSFAPLAALEAANLVLGERFCDGEVARTP